MRKSDFMFRYRVRNRREYNQALISRESITFWVDEQAVSAWRCQRDSVGRGRPQLYTDTAIEYALMAKAVFHLSLRAAQGSLESVMRLMKIELPVPNYTSVCKGQRSLDVKIRARAGVLPRHVVIDITVLNVFGAGEWYVRKHGAARGRLRTCSRCFPAKDSQPSAGPLTRPGASVSIFNIETVFAAMDSCCAPHRTPGALPQQSQRP